ncbi:MAG: peptidoglycan-binding protein [Geminicoccaceae bacterium]
MWFQRFLITVAFLCAGTTSALAEGGSEAVASAAPAVAAPVVADADGVFWNTLQRIAVPELREAALKIYQRAFPSGRFAEVAEVQLAGFDDVAEQEPAPEIVPAVITNELTDLIYWRESSKNEPTVEAARAYLVQFPNGLFADQARARLANQAFDVAVLDRQARDLQAIKLINGGGPQALNLPVPEADAATEVKIVDLPEGRLLHPARGVLDVGSALLLEELGGLRFEPLGASRKDYGEIVLRANGRSAEPLEWATPISVATHDCDQLASDPLDPNKVASGTFFFDRRFSEEDKDLWANGAVIACLKGASDHPGVDRFKANLGRAYAGIEDYEEAMAWLTPLVEQGNPLAQNLMGMIHKNGWGVPQSYERAAALFLAAAQTGHAGAQHDIAWAYGEGRGLPKDDAKMAEWMARSAASGYHQAQYNFGRLHLWGRGVERNVDKAIELLKQAAVQGQTRANYDLAALHEKGEGFAKDEAKARQLYLTAVKSGYPPAFFSYARMLLEGRGGARDIKGGVYHMALAATGSSARTAENARKALAEMPVSDVVRVIQEALAAAGQNPGSADGVMRSGTRTALQTYRSEHGLDIAADILDPATLVTLLAPSSRI